MQKQYTKTVWTDEVPAETPVKYRITEGASIIHEEAVIEPATDITPGTPITAANLNNMEEGIDALDTLMVSASRETIYLKILGDDVALAAGDGKMIFTVPASLNGMEITSVHVAVYTPSSSGLVVVQLYNLSTAAYILSTAATIPQGQYSSYASGSPAVVNPALKVLVTGHRIRVDVSGAGSGTRGLDVIILAEHP